MPGQPYIIYISHYFYGCAGGRVLHKLCHLLNQSGEKAFIYGEKTKTNPDWNTPTISATQSRKLINEGAIVVYPEVASGNPLLAKTVVRYILNNPGLLGGDKTYAESEILFCYVKQLLQPGMTPDRILFIPATDTRLFYNNNQKRDIEYLVYFGKHKKVRGYPEKFTIYTHKPKTEVLTDMLRRCKKLICYDNFTALAFEATLCGCPVVIIPEGSRKREDMEENGTGLNGIAWGESPEEFKKALDTLHKAPARLKMLEANTQSAITNFIAVTQTIAEKRKNLPIPQRRQQGFFRSLFFRD